MSVLRTELFRSNFEFPYRIRDKIGPYHPAKWQEMIANLPLPVVWVPLKSMGTWNPTRGLQPQNCLFYLQHIHTHLIHQCLGRLYSPLQVIAPSVHTFRHHYTSKFPLVTMGRPKFTPKTAPSPSTIITKIWYTIHNDIRMHSAVLSQYWLQTNGLTTDQQMDRLTANVRSHISRFRLLYLIGSTAANNNESSLWIANIIIFMYLMTLWNMYTHRGHWQRIES